MLQFLFEDEINYTTMYTRQVQKYSSHKNTPTSKLLKIKQCNFVAAEKASFLCSYEHGRGLFTSSLNTEAVI